MNAREWCAEHNPSVLFADGFDEAIIGVAERSGQEPLVVYSIELMAEILIERDGMSDDEALEYLGYNVLGAWVGDETPLFLWPLRMEDIEPARDS